MCKEITGNREYKDNIFRLLFGEESKSAELYNAIKGTNYAPNMLKMNTIQNPFFFGVLRNDISFTIEDRLIVLFEHNSTINPNMGLRFLLYIAQLYEMAMDKKAMYKTKPMSIANPEFYMIYNGKEEYPEKMKVKLSDLFIIQDGGENNLELIVTVINANKGHNKSIMIRSKTLDEYAEFVAKVHDYIDNSGFDLTEALKKAVEDCAREGILQEFLQKYGGDIVNILYREFNLNDALRVREEEAKESMQEEIAENLFRLGLSIEKIAESTKLPIEKVKKLAKKYHKNK